MSDEERRRAIRERLALARYPRASAARVADDPDHNPKVLEDCPACHGSGRRCEESAGLAALRECEACEGKGTTGRVVRLFPEGAPPVHALPPPLQFPPATRNEGQVTPRASGGTRRWAA